MKTLLFKNKDKILRLIISLLFGGSLTVLCLFNLPLFYEQEKAGLIKIFAIVFLGFAVAIWMTFDLVLIPVKYITGKNGKHILFIVCLCTLLAAIFSTTPIYYWSVPKNHHVEICYTSDKTSDVLPVLGVLDHKIGRLYPSGFFDHNSYPILVAANNCLVRDFHTVQDWTGIDILIDQKAADGVVLIKMDHHTKEATLSEQATSPAQLSITMNGFSNWGTAVHADIFAGKPLGIIKLLSILMGSIYLALFIFGLSEMIINQDGGYDRYYKIALAVVIVYFLCFGFLMANHGGQPDQGKHVYFSSRYSESWGFPKEDLNSRYFVKDNVYFYYWVNGIVVKIYHLVTPDSGLFSTDLQKAGLILTREDIFLLRIVSVIISTGTIYYLYKLTAVLSGNKFAGILASFFAANTLMFVYVSGGISFDNFLGLCSVVAIYYLVNVLKGEDYVKNTSLLGIWLGLGALTKNEGALFAFILFLIWLIYSFIRRKSLKFQFGRPNIVFILLLVVTSGLFLKLYGGNLIKYHRPIPKCQMIKPAENCTRFTNRASERQVVDYSQLWMDRNVTYGPFEYALDFWIYNEINGIWGIVSTNTYAPRFLTALHGCLIVVAGLCMARYWKKDDLAASALIMITICYAGYLFFFNYSNELKMGFRHYAVQGRYLFPVLSAFYALMVTYLLKVRPLILSRAVISLALILYFGGGLGIFIFRYADVFITWRILLERGI